MKKSNILIIIMIIVLIGFVAFSALRNTGNVVKEDIFEGTITNMNLQPQVLDGEGVYDRSCNMAGGGMTQCDAGIQTEKGLLNFNYKHNMNMQPCIDQGDNLEVQILEGGKAIVKRK